jgi:hypothetical protein
VDTLNKECPKYTLSPELVRLNKVKSKRLYRLTAKKTFETLGGVIKKGQLGGFVASLDTLSWHGDSWIKEGGMVLDKFRVSGDAIVGPAGVCSGAGEVTDTSVIDGRVHNAFISGVVWVHRGAQISSESTELSSLAYVRNYTLQQFRHKNPFDKRCLHVSGKIDGRVRIVADGYISDTTEITGSQTDINCCSLEIHHQPVETTYLPIRLHSCKISGSFLYNSYPATGATELKYLILAGNTEIHRPKRQELVVIAGDEASLGLLETPTIIDLNIPDYHVVPAKLLTSNIRQIAPLTVLYGNTNRVYRIAATFFRWGSPDTNEWDAMLVVKGYGSFSEVNIVQYVYGIKGITEALQGGNLSCDWAGVQNTKVRSMLLYCFKEFIASPECNS